MNEEYIIAANEKRTSQEARENARKGGIASGVARRAKRDARETARMVLSFKPDLPPEMLAAFRKMGAKAKDMTPDMRLIATLAIAQKAIKGDLSSYRFLVDMAGETPDAQALDAKSQPATGTDTSAVNADILSLADLINEPSPSTRSIDDVLAEADGDDP